LTPEALAARRPVWAALGQLFADTDVRLFYPHILRVLAESPFTVPELEKIFTGEVVPSLQSMAFSLYPPWHGLDDDWVIAQVEKHLGKRRWWPPLVDMRQEWDALALLLARLRALPGDAERQQRLALWHDLLPLLLDRNPLRREKGPRFALDEYAAAWRGELCPALLPAARQLAKRRPQDFPSEPEIEANWREFISDLAPRLGDA